MLIGNTYRLLTLYLVFSLNWVFAAEYQSHHQQNQSVLFSTDEGVLNVTAYNHNSVEVHYKSETGQLPSYALAGSPQKLALSVKENTDNVKISTGILTVVVNKSPIKLSFYRGGALLLKEAKGFYQNQSELGFSFTLSQAEKLLGGGQRVLGMDRRGHKLPLHNKAHYGYTTKSEQMYYGLPAVMSNKKYALVFDNSASGTMDIGHTDPDILNFSAVGGRSAYLFVAANTYPELIEQFTELTGRQPLPPRWALGNFASRFGYQSEQETRDTVNKFIQQDFPLDAVVLDLYWFGPDVKGHMGNLDWHKETFPTPKKMIQDFKSLGVNTVLITEPFVLTTSKKWQSAASEKALATDSAGKAFTYDFFFGNTGLVDVFSSSGQSWFSAIYADLFKQGVAGWWGDLGEPEVHPSDVMHSVNGALVSADEVHNVYGHKWAELVFNQQTALAPQSRPMLMMRSGFIGSQRYGMIPWTGDVSRSWGGLVPQVELSLQMSVFGLAYTHSDLGGFAGGETFDREMYIRWLQYGVFQPVYRPHAQQDIAPEPVFHDDFTQDIIREYIKLRYQLLPYNYSLAYENSLTGMPLMRPMMFEDESNSSYFELGDQYLWGDSFLVKPVTQAGVEQVKVTLPGGVWFDFWDDTIYSGQQQVTINTNIKHLPVLVRAGAFIPMVDPVQSTQDYSSESLTLHYYDHQSIDASDGVMFEDDGQDSMAIANQSFEKLLFTSTRGTDSLYIELASLGHYPGMPENRIVELIIHNISKRPTSVAIQKGNSALSDKAKVGIDDFKWDHSNKQLNIAVPLVNTSAVTIQY